MATAAAPTRHAGPDDITVKDEGVKHPLHPAGPSFLAVCVDIIALGEKVKTYAGKSKIAEMIALVFWTGEKNPETGEMLEVRKTFVKSLFERANLRLFLESWRGRSYSEARVKQGVKLAGMHGQPALISVEHSDSGNGSKRVYANIKSIAPLPPLLPPPTIDLAQYRRDPFWEELKRGYKVDADRYRAESLGHENDPGPQEKDEDDDLPF